MRRDFLRQVLTESQTLAEQYERALARLEAELAAAGDYEAALEVKKRRSDIQAAFLKPELASGSIVLPHTQVKLSGTAEVRGEELTGWKSTSSYVEWRDFALTPGSYYLELEASVADQPTPGTRTEPRDKVSFTFQQLFPPSGAELDQRSFELSSQGQEGVWQAIRVGPMRVQHSPITLRLSPQSGYPANRISFRHLRLVPAEAGTIQAAAMPEKDALLAARETLEKELTAALETVLKGRSAEATAEGKKRLAELGTLLREKGTQKLLARLLRQTGGPEDWVEVEAATLVQPEQATGERWMIQHGNEVTPIRLLWLDGIPLDDRGGRLRQFADRLGVEPSALGALAVAARDFTVGYLQGRSLQVLMEPTPGPDGAHSALVFVTGVGLFQSVLAAQGLALVRPLDQPLAPGLEQGLRATLEASQESAKKQGNGIWAARGGGVK
jgi:hypothetical protein